MSRAGWRRSPLPKEPALPARLVVLASGEGTTLQAVLDATGDPSYGAEVVAVLADRPARALQRAPGVSARCVPMTADRAAWGERIEREVAGHRPDVVVCAGFMRLLPPAFVQRFRCVNTHPSLLPAFPGAYAVRDALAAGVPETGVTVHLLDEGLDTGPVLAQQPVPVEPGDTVASLTARIQAVERPLFTRVVGELARTSTRGNP